MRSPPLVRQASILRGSLLRHREIEQKLEHVAQPPRAARGGGRRSQAALFLHDRGGPLEHIGLLIERPGLRERLRHLRLIGGAGGLAGQRGQPIHRGPRQPLERQGPHHGGPTSEQVPGRLPIIFQIAAPVFEIVEHLEAGADVQGVAGDRTGILGLHACQPDSHRHRRLERRRRLEAINLKRGSRSEPLVRRIPPPQFGTLAAGQPHMRVGQHGHEVALRGGIDPGERRHDPVAEPEQVVARIDGRRHPVVEMERGAAIPHRVGVFDVVVNQRRLVEDLDRDGHCLHGLAHVRRLPRRPRPISLHGVERREGDERPQKLPASGEIFARHRRRGIERLPGTGARRGRRAEGARAATPLGQIGERRARKHLGCLAQERQIVADRGRATAGHAEQPQHPLHVDGRRRLNFAARSAARPGGRGHVVRHRGDRQREGRQHGKGFFEMRQLRHAEDPVVLASEQGADGGHGPLRRLDHPATLSSRRPDRADRARRPADLRRGAGVGQGRGRRTVGQQQQATATRAGGEPLTPILGDDRDHRPSHEFGQASRPGNEGLGLSPEPGCRLRGGWHDACSPRAHEVGGERPQPVARLPRGWA